MSESPTRATDEQRVRVSAWLAHLPGWTATEKGIAAILADSEVLAAQDGEGHLTLGDAVDALIATIDGGKRPAEDARLVVNELSNWRFRKYPGPAPTARTRGEVMADEPGKAEVTFDLTPDPRTLDLIAWSLRLPLLRDARAKRSVLPGAQTGPPEPESARLDTLITEGERALGILPEEEAS